MIYIIAILLLILVLANETARNLLGLLLIGAVVLAIVGAILFAIVMLGVWLFTSHPSPNVSAPIPTPPPPATATSASPLTQILVGVFIVGIIVLIIVDQYRLRKK
jgi:NADH:ubiquinone oxidoreductase subunit 6 (subunit J)